MTSVAVPLKVTEIFYSLQGESTTVGIPTVFVRLTGCPLRCNYCDTAYAFTEGKRLSLEAILENIAGYNCRYVTVTGGEPLAQAASLDLMKALCDQQYNVSIETSGALSVEHIDPRVQIVMDLKTPSSTQCHKNLYTNIQYLKLTDQIKFVIASRADYEWAVAKIAQYDLKSHCNILFSPSHGVLDNQVLADWIIQDSLGVRFQLQLHKYIWSEDRGR